MNNGPRPLQQILDEAVVRNAKDLAWHELSARKRTHYLKQAKEEQDEDSYELAGKCMDEAEKAFSEPGFISRADPRAYRK